MYTKQKHSNLICAPSRLEQVRKGDNSHQRTTMLCTSISTNRYLPVMHSRKIHRQKDRVWVPRVIPAIEINVTAYIPHRFFFSLVVPGGVAKRAV